MGENRGGNKISQKKEIQQSLAKELNLGKGRIYSFWIEYVQGVADGVPNQILLKIMKEKDQKMLDYFALIGLRAVSEGWLNENG